VKIGRHAVPAWIIIAISVSSVVSGVFGYYYAWQTLNVPFEVEEPIEIQYYPSMLSLFPGKMIEFNITVQNYSDLNYSVILDFQLGNKTYQEDFVYFSNSFYEIKSGLQNLTASVSVLANAPPIESTLLIDFKRTTE
jgi:hypothetical protein